MKKKILSLLLIISMFSATFSTIAFAASSTNEDFQIGDVDKDGFIKANDAMLVLQYLENSIELEDDQLYLADVQADGVVDKTDAELILQDVVGIYDIAANYKEYVEEDSSEITRALYETLDDEDKELYDSMITCIMNQEERVECISLTTTDAMTDDEKATYFSELSTIAELIYYDYPEIFWYSSYGASCVTTTYDSGTSYKYTFYFKPTYLASEEYDIENMQTEVDNATADAVTSITATVGNEATDYDIVKAVYDYVVLNVDYNSASELNQTLYSALVNKSSVCTGYAKEVQYLLNQFGISACFVSGTASDSNNDSQSHAWNYVMLDGEYYFVDATWGDGFSGQYPTSVYYYYLCGDVEQYTLHQPDDSIEWPTNFGEKYIHGADLIVIYNADGTVDERIWVTD